MGSCLNNDRKIDRSIRNVEECEPQVARKITFWHPVPGVCLSAKSLALITQDPLRRYMLNRKQAEHDAQQDADVEDLAKTGSVATVVHI